MQLLKFILLLALLSLPFCIGTSGQSTRREQQLNCHLFLCSLPFSTTVALLVIWHRWLLSVPLFTIRIYFGVYVKLSCLPMFVRVLLCQFIWLHHSPSETVFVPHSSIYYYCALIIRQSVLIRFNLNLYPHTN